MASSADELVTITLWQFWLGVAGIGLLIGTLVYTRRAAETVGTMRRSERAYVTMSHRSPGLDLTAQGGHAAITIEIKNCGRTPATVTDVLLKLDWFGDGNPAPDQPDYQTDRPRKEVGFFLVTESFFVHPETLPIPNEGEGDELWLYGYVDYSDEFGQDHRGGYARIYSAGRPNNNLVFVNKRGWNYDRPRLPDEDNEAG